MKAEAPRYHRLVRAKALLTHLVVRDKACVGAVRFPLGVRWVERANRPLGLEALLAHVQVRHANERDDQAYKHGEVEDDHSVHNEAQPSD